jgi:hypothetical protein
MGERQAYGAPAELALGKVPQLQENVSLNVWLPQAEGTPVPLTIPDLAADKSHRRTTNIVSQHIPKHPKSQNTPLSPLLSRAIYRRDWGYIDKMNVHLVSWGFKPATFQLLVQRS